MRPSLAKDALEMALSARVRAGEDVSGLTRHSDSSVQYRSVVYGETLAQSQVIASVGSRGDSYDNAMAEALNSVFKAELINRRTRPWPGLRDVLVATSTWVGWYNNRRVHSALGYRSPCKAHQEYTAAKAQAA
ncbi:integrase core domain-containing protein [Corynebacterium timonense]|nr:integrase core domain-containing protein [Corynebacterium timonense]